MGCFTDAISFLDTTCSGKSSCEYFVAGPDLLATQPCPRGTASYLDVRYKCIKGIPSFQCQQLYVCLLF